MKEVTPQQLQNILKTEEEVLVLDVREPHEHAGEHIPNVYNLPLCDIPTHIKDIQRYGKIYVHCQSGRRSEAALKMLQEHGISASHMAGGIQAWKDAGHPVRKSSKVLPVMQQVLLVAGLLVLAGSILTAWIHPLWILLPAFVGGGLSFAGATGHCLMAKLLGYMPWNRTQKKQLPWE